MTYPNGPREGSRGRGWQVGWTLVLDPCAFCPSPKEITDTATTSAARRWIHPWFKQRQKWGGWNNWESTFELAPSPVNKHPKINLTWFGHRALMHSNGFLQVQAKQALLSDATTAVYQCAPRRRHVFLRNQSLQQQVFTQQVLAHLFRGVTQPCNGMTFESFSAGGASCLNR